MYELQSVLLAPPIEGLRRPVSRVRRAIFRVLAAAGVVAAGVGVVGIAEGSVGAATAKPIVIGMICSCTGPEASAIAQSKGIVTAWADYTNAHGGIDGHKIDLIVKDDSTNPATALPEVQSLVQQDHIVALMDNSDVDSAWGTYIESAHVPVIGTSESAEGYQNPDFFTQGETLNYTFSKALPAAFKKAGVKKVAYLYCSEVAACASTSAEFVVGLKAVGIQLVYNAGIAAAAPSYTANCLAAKQGGATGMVVGDASGVVTRVSSDCAAQGYDVLQYGNSGTVSGGWLTTAGFNNAIFTMPNYAWYVHNATTKAYFAALAKYDPGETSSPNYGSIATTLWAMGVEIQQAAQLGGLGSTPTAADILKGLYKFKGNTLEGFSGPLTFKKGQPANNGCIFYGGVNGGKFTTPYGLKSFCYTSNPAPH